MKFAYRKEFATESLAEALRRRGWETITTEHPEELLSRGVADIAFTSPLRFAQAIGSVDHAIVPGISITTRGFAGLLKLVFNKGLVSFESVAIKNPTGAEAVIAMMILAEKHDIEPRVVPVAADASLDAMLAAADCALLVGDDAIFNSGGSSSLLDLTDEWEDVVEAPLPYMIAWGRVGAVPQAAIDELAAARDEAVLLLADAAAQHANAAAANTFYQRYLRGEISYTLNESEIAALDAFFRYAFYYSAITDIPTIKLLPDGELANFPA
jgi:predicted solute-binding protein